MGRMLEALREIESRRPTSRLSEPTEPEIAPRAEPEVEPVAPVAAVIVAEPEEAAAPAEAESVPDVDVPPEIERSETVAPIEDLDSHEDASLEIAEPPTRFAVASDTSEAADNEPLDPRYVALADTMLAGLPADRKGVLLLAGLDDNVGGALRPLFPLLAQQIAGRAIVVDCNEGCRAFARRDDDSFEPESAGVDSDGASWLPFVFRSSHPGLDLLLGVEATAEDAAAPRFEPETLVAELRQAYQLVLLVGAPSSDLEIASLAGLCDGTYLTIRLGETSRRRVDRATRVLQRADVDVLGCVLLEA